MAEYIDRETAIKTAEHAYNEWNLAMAAADGKREINLVYKRQELCKAVASVFDSAPAADVAPVVHGRWIGAPLCGNDSCRCSECGSWHNIHANLRGEIMQKYCPNCGAKMDGGDSDDKR